MTSRGYDKSAEPGEGGRATGVVAAFVLALLFVTLAGVPGQILGGDTEGKDWKGMLPTLFSFVFAWLFVALWLRWREKRPFTSIGLRPADPGRQVLYGVLAAAGLLRSSPTVRYAQDLDETSLKAALKDGARLAQTDTNARRNTIPQRLTAGQGLAGQLVEEAVRATREDGLTIVPVCSYVETWLGKHPEHGASVAPPTDADRAAADG